jgi:hypothetical protein
MSALNRSLETRLSLQSNHLDQHRLDVMAQLGSKMYVGFQNCPYEG